MEREIETSEVLKAVPITKNTLDRLRRQYVEVQPARRIANGALLWPASIIATLQTILRREQESYFAGGRR